MGRLAIVSGRTKCGFMHLAEHRSVSPKGSRSRCFYPRAWDKADASAVLQMGVGVFAIGALVATGLLEYGLFSTGKFWTAVGVLGILLFMALSATIVGQGHAPLLELDDWIRSAFNSASSLCRGWTTLILNAQAEHLGERTLSMLKLSWIVWCAGPNLRQ